jgi:hypothetical protein
VNALCTLLYLDGTRLVRAARNIAKSPGRGLLWILFIAWLVMNAFLRRTAHYQGLFGELHEPYATAAGASVLAILAMSAFGGAGGRVGTFANEAEATLLVRADLPPKLAVLWLQLRAGARVLARFLFFVAVIVLNYAHSHLAGTAAGLFSFLVLSFAVQLPSFLIGKRLGARRLQAILIAVSGVFGFAAVLAFVLGTEGLSLGTPLGSAALALWSGEPLAVTATIAISAAVLILASESARDAYPELYEALKHSESVRTRWRRGIPSDVKSKPLVASSLTTALSGPWVILWKDLALLRRRRAREVFAMLLALCAAGGLLVGLLALQDAALAMTVGSTAGSMGVLFLSTMSARLALDIGKPLWWMGDGSTMTKLALATLSAAATTSGLLAAAAVTAALVVHSGVVLCAGLCTSLALPIAMRSIGVLAFALLPSAIDQRGPAALLRVFVTFGSLIVPMTLGITGSLLVSPYIGILAATLALLGEALAALFLAARRIERSPFEIARAAL